MSETPFMAVAPSTRGPYRKGVERRRQLVQAATVIFARHGYVAASLREVADEVGVSLTGLLRLFGSKENLLMSVLEQWGDDTDRLHSHLDVREGLSYFTALPQLMRLHKDHPGPNELLLTLRAEASDPEHPARDWVASHYAKTIDGGMRSLEKAERQGLVKPMDRQLREAEVRGLVAVMDGLQLQSIVEPGLDLVGLFDEAFVTTMSRWTGGPVTHPVDERPPGLMLNTPRPGRGASRGDDVSTLAALTGVAGSYRTGIERRRQIVDEATRVFAVRGYAGASLREVASRVGVTAPALVRYFGSKEELLMAVLERWDLESEALRVLRAGGAGLEYFDALVRRMARQREHPGLVELLLTLCTEATDPDHPARDWLARRYRRITTNAIEALEAAGQRGQIQNIPLARREAEARWHFAVMDGLELQWMSNPAVDLEAIFALLNDLAVHRWQNEGVDGLS